MAGVSTDYLTFQNVETMTEIRRKLSDHDISRLHTDATIDITDLNRVEIYETEWTISQEEFSERVQTCTRSNTSLPISVVSYVSSNILCVGVGI